MRSPLSDTALSILASVVKRNGRDLVFGQSAAGFSGWSRRKARVDEASGVTRWTLHDLRRSFATHLGEMGVVPHVIEALLNHVSGSKAGVGGVYNRQVYAAEKRAAMGNLGGSRHGDYWRLGEGDANSRAGILTTAAEVILRGAPEDQPPNNPREGPPCTAPGLEAGGGRPPQSGRLPSSPPRWRFLGNLQAPPGKRAPNDDLAFATGTAT